MFFCFAAARRIVVALLGLSFMAFEREASADDLERPPAVESVRVTLKARRTVYLEQRDDDGEWKPVCAAPCGIALPVDGTYRIVGAEGRTSAPVVLTPGSDNELDVDPELPVLRRSYRHTAGVAFTVTSGLFLAPAALVTLGVLAAGMCGSQYCPSAGDVAEGYGSPFVLIPLVAGLAAASAGAALLLGDPIRDPKAPVAAAAPAPFAPSTPRTATLLRLAF